METWRHRDMDTLRHGDMDIGDKERWRHRDMDTCETWRYADIL